MTLVRRMFIFLLFLDQLAPIITIIVDERRFYHDDRRYLHLFTYLFTFLSDSFHRRIVEMKSSKFIQTRRSSIINWAKRQSLKALSRFSLLFYRNNWWLTFIPEENRENVHSKTSRRNDAQRLLFHRHFIDEFSLFEQFEHCHWTSL